MKTAFVFPGQGAQYVGMAADYIAKFPEFAAVLDSFDESHNSQLRQIISEGPEEALKETRFTQPAILFHSICALKAFEAKCQLKPDFGAGIPSGDITALGAAGMLPGQDDMHQVHKRGEFMIKANAGVPFAMAAVLGLEAAVVSQVCAEVARTSLVMAVNFNTPIQTVISGTEEGVAKASELLKAKGAKRVLPLTVGGPFHTPLIESATGWLSAEMEAVPFSDGTVPVVSNLDAAPALSGAENRYKLERQIISPVRWVESVQYMIEEGVQRFVEFGPQKVLSGMIKNIDKDVQIWNLDKLEELDALVEALR